MVSTFFLSVLLVGLLSMYFERQIDDRMWNWCTHKQIELVHILRFVLAFLLLFYVWCSIMGFTILLTL